jgi:hypothetical protein
MTPERSSSTAFAASRSARLGPATQRAADRYYQALVASEIHRMALELRAAPPPRPLEADCRVA